MSAPEGLAFEPFVDDGGNIGIRLNQEVVVYTPEEQAQIRAEFERLIAENAKLRELVRDMWFWHYEGHIDSESQERQMKHIDRVIDRMRELGVDE